VSTSDPRPGATPPTGPQPTGGAAPDPVVHTAPAGGGAAGTASSGGGSQAVGPSDVRTSGGPDPQFPQAQGPRTTGVGGHALGILVGFVLVLVAIVVIALGMSRILAANSVGEETVTIDGLGVVLVTLGGIVAALVALLAVRTSTIPFTGGLVALVLGAAYLFAPEATHRETVRLLATEQNSDAVLNTLTVCLVGVPFVLGLVLLASGTAASLVRRRGIAVGSFRATQSAKASR
jgi:hypothetical protein